MDPSNITNCIECGSIVSKSAEECQNRSCGTTHPFGWRCGICGGMARKSECHIHEQPDNIIGLKQTLSYHIICMQELYCGAVPLRCADCDIVLRTPPFESDELCLMRYYRTNSCPRCGCPEPIHKKNCCYCSLPILLAFQTPLVKITGHPSGDSVHEPAHSDCYYRHNPTAVTPAAAATRTGHRSAGCSVAIVLPPIAYCVFRLVVNV